MRTVLMTLMGMLLGGLPALAGTGPAGVAQTPHNLTASNPDVTLQLTYGNHAEDQVCIFCHTPHGGSLDAPLWNRDLSSISGGGVYTHYTSATLSGAVGASNRAVNAESLLCLSCHDGSIGVGDNLYNNSGSAPGNNNIFIQPGFGRPGPRTGGSRANTANTVDLSDDHPISFSYSAVLAAKPGTLQTVLYVEGTRNLVLFGGTERVECSSCHDPHVNFDSTYGGDDDYDPFLAIPNTGSGLCLSCHIK